MSKIKKIAAAFAALSLALCVGYFSVMSPTSAWFYESGVIDSKDSFIFGDVSVNTTFTSKGNVEFEAPTKFSDPNEVLFDEVLDVSSIKVKNSGTVPARVYADVKVRNGEKGLHWFAYTDKTLVASSVKKTIESKLPEMTYSALQAYNVGNNGKGGYYVLLGPGESATVNIATWVEYDEVSTELLSGSTLGYDVEISLIASQDKDSAVSR